MWLMNHLPDGLLYLLFSIYNVYVAFHTLTFRNNDSMTHIHLHSIAFFFVYISTQEHES